MSNKYFAHSLGLEKPERWQELDAHLKNVAEKSAEFGRYFNGEEWAYLAGLCHDVGKGSREFQAYLRNANNIVDEFAKNYHGKVDHSTFGARYVYSKLKDEGKALSYVLAGHHGGLPDWQCHATHGLRYRLEDKEICDVEYECMNDVSLKGLPIKIDRARFGFQLQFFIRMIFSCLVDADFLDTEKFLNPDQNKLRENKNDLRQLREIFRKNFDSLRNDAKKSVINEIRDDILKHCLSSSDNSPGLFSLTVPTGGGKTLASLAFALDHAVKYNKRRIIYVIPFTSIIEQNASVFRGMLGDDSVLEHHCNFTFEGKDWEKKLSSENWDMPMVVTTNVQFFDSFFANRTSRCRKLHNIADSVVIFDEVQAIPVEKLKPCIEVIKELTLNYGVSVVLCSATQPAIDQSDDFKEGLSGIREIVPDVGKLFRILKRTEVSFIGKRKSEDISARINKQDQILCIVSTRKQAKNIFEQLNGSGDNFHLSALMYPAHRTRILSEIKQRLKDGRRCRVVSTQLIEAGVDVDFPVVLRSLSGMDSIAQAAGRCNREGSQANGKVFVFEPEEGIPAGYFRQTAQCSERLLERFKGKLLNPECIREYFLDYYWLKQHRMDDDEVLSMCGRAKNGNIQFEELSVFKMINNATNPIVIAFGEDKEDVKKMVGELDYLKYPSRTLRRLQRYTVQVYPRHLTELCSYLECNGYVSVLSIESLYDDKMGLLMNVPEYLDVEETIC